MPEQRTGIAFDFDGTLVDKVKVKGPRTALQNMRKYPLVRRTQSDDLVRAVQRRDGEFESLGIVSRRKPVRKKVTERVLVESGLSVVFNPGDVEYARTDEGKAKYLAGISAERKGLVAILDDKPYEVGIDAIRQARAGILPVRFSLVIIAAEADDLNHPTIARFTKNAINIADDIGPIVNTDDGASTRAIDDLSHVVNTEDEVLSVAPWGISQPLWQVSIVPGLGDPDGVLDKVLKLAELDEAA